MRLVGWCCERKEAGHVDRQFAGVHFVESAIYNLTLDVHHGETRQHTARDGFLDSVNNRRDVFPGNRAADDLIFDLDAFPSPIRLQSDAGMAILAASAGLADEFALALGALGDRFAVSDLRR